MKNSIKKIVFFTVLLFSNQLFAQNAHFIENGVIEFEKRSNMHAIIKKKIGDQNQSYYGEAFEQYKKANPQFKVSKSTLSFSKKKSLYKWQSVDEPVNQNWLANDAFADLKNTVATDFDQQKSLSQKNIFEEVYLVDDSLRKINWKITDETRTIAGFECRRANALIMDSMYVVAYYSNEIAVSGGPESLTGLPGMILGLALPHENMTWFATKVTEVAVPEKDLVPPVKGKRITGKGLDEIVKAALKNWAPNGASTKVFSF